MYAALLYLTNTVCHLRTLEEFALGTYTIIIALPDTLATAPIADIVAFSTSPVSMSTLDSLALTLLPRPTTAAKLLVPLLNLLDKVPYGYPGNGRAGIRVRPCDDNGKGRNSYNGRG